MTKADIVARIALQTGVEKAVAMTVVETFMETVKDSMVAGNEVFLRGFGSFIIKKRAKKVAPEYIKEHDYRDPCSLRPCVQTCKDVP